MVENKTTIKQLELSERILIKLLEEENILTKRQKIILDANLIDFVRDDMSPLEQGKEYLETIQGLQLNSIENRLIQISGEIEGVKLHIKELKDSLKSQNKKKNDNK